MDHSEDVERLFSWLKAPLVHYREFAPQRELAEAVATWPMVHRAAVETGVAAAAGPAPQGDAAAKERIARDRMTIPGPPVQHAAAAPSEASLAPPEEPAETPEKPSAGRLEDRPGPAFDERVDVGRYEPPETTIRGAPAPSAAGSVHAPAEPTIAGFDQPAAAPSRPAPSPVEAYENRPARPARHYPAPEREALFSGEYRGRERAPRPPAGVADRQDRSLDAVFTRLASGRDRLPDPRARARTSPGLGPVFNRLR